MGECRLSIIRNRLRSEQMDTEFRDNSLICNKRIKIRVENGGNLAIEGPLSLDYYIVRKIVDEIYKIK